MSQKSRNVLYVLSGIVLGLGIVFSFGAAKAKFEAAEDQKGNTAACPMYSVVNTDGAHLIVVDNATSKLYFYAIDKDGKVGDELKLRGSADLHDVGKPGIKPIDAKPQK